MKKLILTFTLIFMTQVSLAGPTVIGTKDNINVTWMNAQENLECYTSHATKMDVVRLNAPLTFLAAGIFRQEFEGADGAVCEKVTQIVEQSFMNFTAFQIIIDSELVLGRTHLVEKATLKISNLPGFKPEEKFPVVEMQVELTQKLQQTQDDFMIGF